MTAVKREVVAEGDETRLLLEFSSARRVKVISLVSLFLPYLIYLTLSANDQLIHHHDQKRDVNKTSKSISYGIIEANKAGAAPPLLDNSTYRTRSVVIPENDYALRPINETEWARLDNQECVGDGMEEPWQNRIPAVVIAGAMKAGTEAIWSYLKQHPQVVSCRGKEQHFFDKRFEEFATPQGIQRGAALRAYANLYHDQITDRRAFANDSTLISMDDTPRYLFWSDRIPRRLFCVAPWVKLLILLRNPVERAYSHYVFSIYEDYTNKPTKMQKESFEDWVEHDMAQLELSGVLNEPADMKAWKRYLRTMDHQAYAVLGKGLYVIQLRHWFEAMDKIGKNREDILILESQNFKDNTQQEYNKVLDFLGLPHYDLKDTRAKHTGLYRDELREDTKKHLEEFFRPFNRELYELLGWGPVWDWALNGTFALNKL